MNYKCLKRVISFIVLLMSCAIQAQVPHRFTYQAVIRNALNQTLANQTIGMRISLLQGSVTGTAVYVETHSIMSNANGQVNLEVGGGTLISGSMAGINWSTGAYFIKTEMDPIGGTNYSIVGTNRLQSVPYSLYATTSGNGVNNGTVNNQMLYWNGSAWVALNPGSNGQILTLCNGVLTWTTGGQCPSSVPCPPLNDFNPSITYGSMIDQEGNIYKTVTIGTQVWMAENLRTGRYRNGERIPTITNDSIYAQLTTGSSCWYNNDSTTYHCNVGRIYSWYAVSDTRNLCPSGWHVPSDIDWTVLSNFLGGDAVAGNKMKSTSGWPNNGNGSNSSGFTGRPGGYRKYDGIFENPSSVGVWWSATAIASGGGWYRNLHPHDDKLWRSSNSERFGFSIRCLKD